jgi:hypothetical protein
MLNRKTKFDKLKDRVRADTKAKLYEVSRGPRFNDHAWIFADDLMVRRMKEERDRRERKNVKL